MNELKKALYRMAAQAAEREALQTKKEKLGSILTFFLPVLFLVLFAIADFWLYVSPLCYVTIALGAGFIYFVVFSLGFVSGQVRGAKYALQNPRKGKTWITITDEGETIWESEKFTPAPAPDEPGPVEISTEDIKTPDREADFLKWMDAWNTVIVSMKETKGDREIMKELNDRDFPSDPRTYKKMRLAGENRKLTMREFERKFRQT